MIDSDPCFHKWHKKSRAKKLRGFKLTTATSGLTRLMPQYRSNKLRSGEKLG